MKGKKIANRFFFVCTLLSTLLFAACSSDSSEESTMGISDQELQAVAETPFSVVLKALDSEGVDVTTQGEVENVALFVFNAQNDFVKQINVGKSALLQRQSIEITCPGTDRITVIAWGGVSSESIEVSALTPANIISELQVALKQNNGVAQIPGDLFYGQVAVNRSVTKASQQELKLERKVSSLSLITKGLVKHFGTTEGNYEYRVHSSNSAFNYKGELIGEQTEYVFPASFDKNGKLVADTQPVLPGSKMVIELYKDGNLLYSAEKDQNGEILAANAGKQMNYVFNYNESVSVQLVVTAWNTLVKYVTVS